MFHNLKTAIRKQKKLILIFLLTIFLPSITISIFGIIALRNERFRLEKQYRERQTEITGLIRSEINRKIVEMDNELRSLVRTPAFMKREYRDIIVLVENQMKTNPLWGQIFIQYDGNEPLFPPFRSGTISEAVDLTKDFSGNQRLIMEKADEYEFIKNDYNTAIVLLRELLAETEDKNLKGQLLNFLARNYMKKNDFGKAAAIYTELIRDYPESRSSSGSIISVGVRLQLAECYLKTGNKEDGLKETLQAFKEIIRNSCELSENQLSAYAGMAREKFAGFREKNPELFSSAKSYADDFKNIDSLYRNKMIEWQVINNLKNECIPDLNRKLMNSNENQGIPVLISKKIGSEDYLILSSPITDEPIEKTTGFAGVKINNDFMEGAFLENILKKILKNEKIELKITDLSGRIIAGSSIQSNLSTGITFLFDDNFPPWRIEVFGETATPIFTGIYKSFYFWTILAMVTVLVFGIIIIGRTIAHEKEVLKLKSDFVSSVSHEFKTPITSIKALTERLLEGAVKDPVRMREYYKVIAQDAENLNQLVWNLLDFSKIEEGKKQYNFEETDIKSWLEQTVEEFFGKKPGIKYKINCTIDEPLLPFKIDKDAMKLAINNLLDNAVKFSPEYSAIEVIAGMHGKNLHLSVKDEGIGIPLNEHNKIFEKFYRAKNASGRSSTGTGLGLTIVKQIVEAHGGEVLVESEPGAGSMFTISIPVNRIKD